MSEWLKIVYLGVVEGLTEFIPVSSTGHLILSESLMPLEMAHSESFSVFIQLGAILAVVVLYWQRFIDLLPTADSKNSGLSSYSGLKILFIACLPAFILGALLHSTIKELLFSPTTVAWALIVGGIVFIFVEKRQSEKSPELNNDLDSITIKQALMIGIFQCFALWPGMSRSGSTIVGGMLVGFSRTAAAEFSFLVAVPVMVAAVAYDLLKTGAELNGQDMMYFALGFLVSFVTAMIAIKFFIALLSKWSLKPFGWYRIILGIIVLVML